MATVVPSGSASSERRTILLAVDDSPGSNFAFTYAINNILTPSDKLILLYVLPEINVDVFYGTPSYIHELEGKLKDAGEALLSRFADSAANHHLVTERKIVKGDARERVVEVAEEVKADLVVVGSRGLGTLSRALLGSVSDYIVNHSMAPVLVVRPPRATHESKSNTSLLSGLNKVGRIVESGM